MDGQWVTVGDGVLARRYSELDLTVGSVLGASRALVVDTRGDAEQGAPPDFGDAVVERWPHTVGALLGLAPTVVVPGHGDPVGPAFVAEQRDRLAEVAALHAAVARGELGPRRRPLARPTRASGGRRRRCGRGWGRRSCVHTPSLPPHTPPALHTPRRPGA